MEKRMASIQSLEDVLAEEIKDLYSAENQILKALPKMIKTATSQSLKDALSAHLEETEQQVRRLEEIGEILQIKVGGKTCKGMKGLLEEGKEVLDMEAEDDFLLDAMIIGACQRVEHYEIAAYGTARAIAEAIGEEQVAALLQETLDEEGEADKKLSAISEGEILQSEGGEEFEAAEEEEGEERPRRGR
jgi:ferritin-like metal-binding protein YciE